ncbi:MAG: hypothetical protein M3361_18690 [Candidatus Tectomicrobia bacterium]|nr:hypothetical protein [Candidatus Tectomicrobia bacterium]
MLLGTVEEFHTSIEHNRGFIPHYGERDRQDERISTSFVELIRITDPCMKI